VRKTIFNSNLEFEFRSKIVQVRGKKESKKEKLGFSKLGGGPRNWKIKSKIFLQDSFFSGDLIHFKMYFALSSQKVKALRGQKFESQ